MNQWPELIPQLMANVTDPSSTEHMKESTLEAIGYICQDIVSGGPEPGLAAGAASLLTLLTRLPVCVQDPEQLQESANQILTAIIQGMRKEEPSNNVKLAATNALLNSLEFTRANFDKEVLVPLVPLVHVCCWTRPHCSGVCVCFQTERHFIMQVVCEATQCPDTRVSPASHSQGALLCGLP